MPNVLSLPLNTISIDAPQCVALLRAWHNSTAGEGFPENIVPLGIVEDLCGAGYVLYPFWDIQARVATWIWPMLLIVALIPTTLPDRLNRAKAYLHVVSNPVDAMRSALVNLEGLKQYHTLCQDFTLPVDLQDLREAAAIVLAVSEAWEIWSSYGGRLSPIYRSKSATDRTRRQRAGEFFDWLNENHEQKEACVQAAEGLSELRKPALFQAIIGMVTYGVGILFAFSHALLGSVNNRTGHSIAFGMLFSGWGVLLFVTCFNPQFVSSKQCEKILRHFIYVDNAPPIEMPETPETAKFGVKRRQSIHGPLMLFGSNPIFATSVTLDRVALEKKTSVLLYGLSVAPFLLSTICAVAISYLNPSRGFGCRSVMQLMFFGLWVLNACATVLFRRIFQAAPDLQWRYTCIINGPVMFTQMVFLILAYIGWFNSPVCWSAKFSGGRDAFILIDPIPEITRLVGFWWPLITCLTSFFHLLLVFGVWWRYHRVIGFYRL